MLNLKDFENLKLESTSQFLGGADPNVTKGGSVTYEAPYYPGGSATGTWSSDYRGVDGLEYCDLDWQWG